MADQDVRKAEVDALRSEVDKARASKEEAQKALELMRAIWSQLSSQVTKFNVGYAGIALVAIFGAWFIYTGSDAESVIQYLIAALAAVLPAAANTIMVRRQKSKTLSRGENE